MPGPSTQEVPLIHRTDPRNTDPRNTEQRHTGRLGQRTEEPIPCATDATGVAENATQDRTQGSAQGGGTGAAAGAGSGRGGVAETTMDPVADTVLEQMVTEVQKIHPGSSRGEVLEALLRQLEHSSGHFL